MAKTSEMPTNLNQRAKAIVDFATGTEASAGSIAWTVGLLVYVISN